MNDQKPQKRVPEYLCHDEYDPKSKKNLLVCSLKIGTQGSKSVTEPAKMILKGTYFKERSNLHKLMDVLSIGTISIVLAILAFLLFPRYTPDFIVVDASVAPTEVITGGASTLTFRYENQSKETLRNVRVAFDFPEHFKLDNIEAEYGEQVGQHIFDLGEIAPTEYGFLHVTGTMFGDVGGEQVFSTTFSYTYGEEDKADTKTINHTFSPTKSTLVLDLQLPTHVVAFQEVEGSITYSNTGDVDFPDLAIKPRWPDTFVLLSSSPSQKDGVFHVNAIKSGEKGIITFKGRLGTEDDSTFTFLPSFKFDDVIYSQETLVDIVEILPPPLTISATLEEGVMQPGGSATVIMTYTNNSEFTVHDPKFRLSTNPEVLSTSGINGGTYSNGYYIFNDTFSEIMPGESGTLTMSIPVKSSLSGVTLQTSTNIQIETTASATFTFDIESATVESNTFGETVLTPFTSPIYLQSFARYWTATGDQLGRGPVPPFAGETTKYWIFWNIAGTTNELTNIKIDADLGPGVTLTGRQSVSVGTSIMQSGNSVVWELDSIEPTLGLGNTIAGAAFEVAITPTESQIGTAPTLLESAIITAHDAFTGGVVTGSASAVSTNLTNDSKASVLGGIVE